MKVLVMAEYKVLLLHFPGGTEENHRRPQSV
jgi:hypothetical protein